MIQNTYHLFIYLENVYAAALEICRKQLTTEKSHTHTHKLKSGIKSPVQHKNTLFVQTLMAYKYRFIKSVGEQKRFGLVPKRKQYRCQMGRAFIREVSMF